MTRSGISRSENERAGEEWWISAAEAVVAEEVGAAAHDVPGPVDAPAGEDVVGLELLPHRRQLGDAGEVGGVGDRGAVEGAGRGPDHDVGHDPPLEEGAQHADLADALVAAARQDERGARSRRAPGAGCARRPAGNGSFVPMVGSSAGSRRGLWVIGEGRGWVSSATWWLRRYPARRGPAVLVAACPRKPLRHGSSLENGPRIYSARPRNNPATEARVTEFYRQYLAVAVFVLCRVPDGRSDARCGASSAPESAAGREVHHLRVGLRPAAAVRADERPLLRLRPALRDLRRRGGLHLPVGGQRRAPGLVRPDRDGRLRRVLLLGLAYVWRKGLLKWA